MRLDLQTEESRLPSQKWVGIIQSLEGLNRTKGQRENLISAGLSELGHCFFLPFYWDLTPSALLVLRLEYATRFPEFPACRKQIVELLSQFLTIHCFTYTYTSICVCVSLSTFICTIGSASLKNPNTDNILMILGALQI